MPVDLQEKIFLPVVALQLLDISFHFHTVRYMNGHTLLIFYYSYSCDRLLCSSCHLNVLIYFCVCFFFSTSLGVLGSTATAHVVFLLYVPDQIPSCWYGPIMYTGLTSYTGFNHYYFVELSDYYSEAKA